MSATMTAASMLPVPILLVLALNANGASTESAATCYEYNDATNCAAPCTWVEAAADAGYCTGGDDYGSGSGDYDYCADQTFVGTCLYECTTADADKTPCSTLCLKSDGTIDMEDQGCISGTTRGNTECADCIDCFQKLTDCMFDSSTNQPTTDGDYSTSPPTTGDYSTNPPATEEYDEGSTAEPTTTTTTSTTHKTKDGSTVATKQTKQITKVGGMGQTDTRLNKTTAAGGARNAFKQMDQTNNPATGKPNFTTGGGGGGAGGLARNPSAIKEMLLRWCQSMTAGYDHVNITNFSSSWNDGMAFCALIHHFYPRAFDYSKLDPKKRRGNFTLGFNAAEKLGNVPQLLEVDDMVRMKNPDWKCVFTYVQQFYRIFRNHEDNADKPKEEPVTPPTPTAGSEVVVDE